MTRQRNVEIIRTFIKVNKESPCRQKFITEPYAEQNSQVSGYETW